ncbi:hypothetical protein SUGI_0536700 [Cryptomeria japonica]|nr:hypothetical protein SUGI_0536700 [Cryptomeria japonica]
MASVDVGPATILTGRVVVNFIQLRIAMWHLQGKNRDRVERKAVAGKGRTARRSRSSGRREETLGVETRGCHVGRLQYSAYRKYYKYDVEQGG